MNHIAYFPFILHTDIESIQNIFATNNFRINTPSKLGRMLTLLMEFE